MSPNSEPSSKQRRTAALQALFITFLWSTSWVLIKIGLQEVPALTFAGLRYALAVVCLLPFALASAERAALRSLTRRDWALLAALGLTFYTLAQGAQFLALESLPAVTISLLLNFSAVVVALLGVVFLGERPSLRQWLGAGLFLLGAGVYFYPAAVPAGQGWGLAAAGVGVLATSLGSVIGRGVNRGARLSPLLVTTLSMGIGSTFLLGTGMAVQGLPRLSPLSLGLILWLAVVNTAFAFTLWNRTLRTLTAMESSVLNNTMLVQIALLAWMFLGENLNGREVVGLALAAAGALLVQLRR